MTHRLIGITLEGEVEIAFVGKPYEFERVERQRLGKDAVVYFQCPICVRSMFRLLAVEKSKSIADDVWDKLAEHESEHSNQD